jgi:hypothetical protein
MTRALSPLLALALFGSLACQNNDSPGGGGTGGTPTGGTGARGGTGGRGGGTGGSAGTGGTAGSGGSAGSGGTAGAGGSAGAGGTGGSAGSGGAAGTDAAPGDGGASDGGGDGAPGASLLDNPTAAPPASLKDVGLFPAFPDMTQVNPRAFYFEPKYPLYSNGLSKKRYAVLPAGQKIDTSKRDAWDYPVGTLFFKTFFHEAATTGGQPRPVETRLIRRKATTGEPQQQWEFFVWQWTSDGTNATLPTEVEFRNGIPKTVRIGGRDSMHTIPKRSACWNCHIANKSTVIGFDELRLNSTLPGKTQTQLDEVIGKSWLTAAPPKPWFTITDANPTQRQVLEYFHANCAHCHNGEPPLEPGARYDLLDLRWDKALAATIGIRTMTVGTADGVRVVRGQPVQSILFLALEGMMNSAMNPEVKLMPPVGVEVPDQAAITLFRNWITSLPR